MKSKYNFLFVSHELSATGAPIVLLNTIKKIKSEFDANIYVYAIKGGKLRHLFDEASIDLCVEEYNEQISGWPNFQLVYFNSIESSHKYKEFLDSGVINAGTRTLLHAHEMFGTVHKYGIENSKKLVNIADYVICASDTVKSNMLSIGFDEDKMDVIKPLISMEQPQNDSVIDEIDVVACGEISFNKGIDYFVQLAKSYTQRFPEDNVNFVWIGPDSRKLKALIDWDIKNLDLSDRVRFIGYQADVRSFFSKSKIFILPSRQDSFPLVCLEALSEGLPILFFKESGGMRDFLDNSCAITLNYLDVADGVDKLNLVLNKSSMLENMKTASYTKYNNYISAMNNDFLKTVSIVERILND